MKAGHIGAVSLALCAAAGAAMFALSGGKKAEYCSLGEYHGRVAIFAPDERTLPRQITAIAVHTLPSADRAALSFLLFSRPASSPAPGRSWRSRETARRFPARLCLSPARAFPPPAREAAPYRRIRAARARYRRSVYRCRGVSDP